ncbi:YrrS family protein [Virgibacillus byunsanensis]|uniref:YrrS family protein n=1 Tax=Virgibacillus byunsanensis TaxID=570945 RepID=A0ABW3LJJ2_9BACI
MSDFDNYSRVNKFEKRRKNTKSISILLILGSILIIVLLGMWIFGGDDEESDAQPTDTEINEDETNENTDEDTVDEDTSSEEGNTTEEDGDSNEEENDANNNVDVEEAEPTDDENVLEAYTGDWQPVGTDQEGEHTTTYEEGSQDRNEMEQAIRVATRLQEGNMTTWWLENGGDQKVIATVSNKDESENYRVYLSWIDNQGWQPTKVEILKENDQKYRFE